MSSQRKSILVIHPAAEDAAAIRRLLANMGHTAVTVARQTAALKLLGSVRFDVIFTAISAGGDSDARQFIGQLRQHAPGSAVVGIHAGGAQGANTSWHGACDAIIAEPLTASRVQWVLDFQLRYFGS